MADPDDVKPGEDEIAELEQAMAAERRRQIAVEHLFFQTAAYVEAQHPGLIDRLEESIDHLGDPAGDDTKDDDAVRDVARLFIESLRKHAG